MHLDYFDLLSPEPISFRSVCGVRCPTLREINKISYSVYQFYLSLLLLTPQAYFSMIQRQEAYDIMTEEEKALLNTYELLVEDQNLCPCVEKMLNFFLVNHVKYDSQYKAFLLYQEEDTKPCGIIQKELWPQLCNVILQRNYIRPKEKDFSHIKSKRALAIMEKLRKGRANKEINTKADMNMEIGNIISAVANKSGSLNIINIWDITIYQLWDAFYRLCNNSIYHIQAMSVAAYGDKDHHFDSDLWYKNLSKSNQ